MRRLLYSWACVLAFGTTLLAQNPEVRRLKFEGVEHVDVHDLETSIATRASTCRNVFLQVFCLFSRAPAFEERQFLDEDDLRRDVLRVRLYYWKRGYRETEVDTTVRPSGLRQVDVTFKVREGPPTRIRRLTIAYDSSLIKEKVRRRLTLLRTGDPLDLVVLDSMRVLFQNQLWDLGYGDATADTSVVVDQPAHIADVVLTVMPNRRTTIGRITVAGNERIDIQTISRLLAFETGDLYRQTTIIQSQRNLYESNLFRLATIYVPPQHDSAKRVSVEVIEAPLHEARVGPGMNNIEFLQLQSHYTDYNLFGSARRLDLDANAGNLFAPQLAGRGIFRDVIADIADSNVKPFLQPTFNASLDFKQPALLGRPSNSAAIGAFGHRTINPGVFIDRGYGGQLTLTREVKFRAPLSLNYRYELNRVQASDTYFCVNYGVCDTLTISTLRSRHALSPATFTGYIDRSDAPLSPTKGYIARLDLEQASTSTGSDYSYYRVFFDGAVYTHRSGMPQVYTAHLRVGVVRATGSSLTDGSTVLHPRKRFYAGGANSVRGYAEGQLGPRVLTIPSDTLIAAARSVGGKCADNPISIKFCDPNTPDLPNNLFLPQPLGGTSLLEGSIEYRFPLPLPEPLRNFVGAVFIDAGVVGSSRITGLNQIGNIVQGTGAVTPGIGLRYQSPVGPIRVDVGVNPNRVETLGVVTTVRDFTGTIRVVPLAIPRRFSTGNTLFNRLALHLSIGEAY